MTVSPITWDLSQLHEGPAWRGAVDGFTDEWIYGWVVATREPATPVELRIFLFGQPVLTGISAIFREDIAALLQQPVRTGFSVPLRDITPEDARKILAHLAELPPGPLPIAEILRIEVEDTGLALPLSEHLGHVDRAALHRQLALRARHFASHEEARIHQRDHLLTLAAARPERPVQILAFYRAEFYPYAEGENLTQGYDLSDWAAVASAQPRFAGHAQPRLPTAGFYDLRVDAVQEAQIALARHHGISGFCYDYYWHDDQSPLSLPIERHLAKGYDFDFCLTWVNAPLYAAGQDKPIFAPSESYSTADGFIRSCLKYFRAPRYIRFGEAPLLLVRGVAGMKNPAATFRRWRKILRAEGIADLHISMVEDGSGIDPRQLGCDSSCQYPPEGLAGADLPLPDDAPDSASTDAGGGCGKLQDYADAVQGEIARPPAAHIQFRTAVPGWDDTPRQGRAGRVLKGSTPDLFGLWLRHLIADARARLPEAQRIVFVRSWNDWAAGAMLEPDRQNGTAMLEALGAAVSPAAEALEPLLPPPRGQPDPLAATRRHVEGLMATNRALSALAARRGRGLWGGSAAVFVPAASQILQVAPLAGQQVGIDRLNGHPVPPGINLPVARSQGLALQGWFLLHGQNPGPALIALRNTEVEGPRHVTALYDRLDRPDVAAALAPAPVPPGCGFTLNASLEGLPPGRYALEILIPDPLRPLHAVALSAELYLLIG